MRVPVPVKRIYNDDLTAYRTLLKCVSGHRQREYKMYSRGPATPSLTVVSILRTYNLTNWHTHRRINIIIYCVLQYYSELAYQKLCTSFYEYFLERLVGFNWYFDFEVCRRTLSI